MGLEAPRLDDRAFDDIVEEARRRIPIYTPEWTDHNLSDPGITLIELFAWMTDIVLYRLNRVPDKHYIKFMELIGMRLHDAEPARVPVSFWLTKPQPISLTIPSGAEVATTRTETEPAIVFTTDGAMEIKVPKLVYVMTSHEDQEGRTFESHNVEGVQSGFEGFPAFVSQPPDTGDALYLGFQEDMSNHLLGVTLEVNIAEGAGIDPTNPPYLWEVLSTELGQEWIKVAVDLDTTQGLNVSGMIRLHLPPMQRAERDNKLAYWLRCRLDLSATESRYNVSPQIERLQIDSWGGTIGTTNVTLARRVVLGRSDGSPGQRFYLDHTPVVARTTDEHIIVRIDDQREERWEEVSDFSSSTANDRHYTIDSNTGEVRFGPALPQRDGQVQRYGAIPPKNALIVMTGYRYGGGVIGNVAKHTINVLKTALPYIDRVTNREAASGGMNVESLESSKMRVPGYLRSLGRAVTAADYEYLAQEAAPGRIGRVHCLQPPLTNRGEVQVLVIPQIPSLHGFIAPESLELPADVRDEIQVYLDARRLLATKLEVTAPAYQWVETEVRLRVSQHYDFERVRQAVEAKLYTFLNPLVGGPDGNGWPFGRDLFVSDLIAVLLTVPGVDFIRSVKLFPIDYEDRQFMRGAETQQVAIASHGVVVSYQHNILPD